jgi:uncharacterized hydrophobic protein (TIGR00271 family)
MRQFFIIAIRRLKQKRDDAASRINHEGVIKDVFLEVEISTGYFFILSLANLIALTGLIVGSAPVIIGAMLISPLMGPILSTGFAFATGNKTIWRRALKKVSLSVALTLAVAAVASFFSPLQDITTEIAARTRPNLYDLLIAIFAGLAGAIAICTKKNYLTIVPGVAIATAVIPPLSVAGFGIGTGNAGVMAGGFFLFFTNFVAIVIATCVVMYYFGFSPTSDSGLDKHMVRRRVVFLAAVLCIISLPLIYTLRLSVVELGLKKKIQIVLKTRFDQTGISRLATFTHSEAPDKRIVIDAVINTTRYLSEKEISLAEQEIVKTLRRPVVFHLEQVKVQPGGLKDEVQAKSFVTPQVKKQRPHAEIVTEARNELLRLSEGVAEKINAVISPSTVRDFIVGIPRRDSNLSLTLTIGRDHPLSKDELRILEKMISGEFGVPVLLRVETVPFIPPLLFSDGEVTISEEMKRSLLVAGKVVEGDPVMTITVASRPAFPATRNRNRHAAERAASVTAFLKESHAVPDDRIRTVTLPAEKGADPAVTVRILPGNE